MNGYIVYLLLLLVHPTKTADIIEQMIRNIAIQAQNIGEKVSWKIKKKNRGFEVLPPPHDQLVESFFSGSNKTYVQWLSSIEVPKMEDNSLMFSLDEKQKFAAKSMFDFVNTCPPALPVPSLVGIWHLTAVNRNLKNTLFADVDEGINILEAGGNLMYRKSLLSLLNQRLFINCVQISVLNDTPNSPMELSYFSIKGRRSIIGSVTKTHQTIAFQFLPTVILNAQVVYASIAKELGGLSWQNDVLVLAETNNFPKCSNYLVLQRSTTVAPGLMNILTAIGSNSVLNPMEFVTCSDPGVVNEAPNPIQPEMVTSPISINPNDQSQDSRVQTSSNSDVNSSQNNFPIIQNFNLSYIQDTGNITEKLENKSENTTILDNFQADNDSSGKVENSSIEDTTKHPSLEIEDNSLLVDHNFNINIENKTLNVENELPRISSVIKPLSEVLKEVES